MQFDGPLTPSQIPGGPHDPMVAAFFRWLEQQPAYVRASMANMKPDIRNYHIAAGPSGWNYLRQVADSAELAMRQQSMNRQIDLGLKGH